MDLSRNSTKASSTTVGVLTDKQRKISWNKGTIPFGSGSNRDLNPLKRFYVPGPDQYDVINVQGTKPMPLKGVEPQSPQRRDLRKQ